MDATQKLNVMQKLNATRKTDVTLKMNVMLKTDAMQKMNCATPAVLFGLKNLFLLYFSSEQKYPHEKP